MKVFLKWTLLAFLFLSVMVSISIFSSGVEQIHIFPGLIAVIAGALFLGIFYYSFQTWFIPFRRSQLTKKLNRLFGARTITESISHFRMGLFDVYAQIDHQLVMAEHGSYELISFHIPREQIGFLVNRSERQFAESYCNGIATYRIYQSAAWNLNSAKTKIEKRLN
jgi:hypothetical protein